jgi:hypothetical protein
VNWFRRLFIGTIARDIHDRIVNDLREQLRDERQRTRKLMATVVKMKVAGGSIPRALPGVAQPPRQLTDVEERIIVALDANPRTRRPGELRNRHRTWAERQVAQDPSDANVERVCKKLATWGVVDADDDDDDVIAVVSRG